METGQSTPVPKTEMVNWFSRMIGILFLVPFFLGGGYFLMAGIRAVQRGDDAGWGIVGFATVFLLFATGFLLVILRRIRRVQARNAQREQVPDKPWLLNEHWAAGRIPSGSGGKVAGFWFFAVVWNAVSCPILFAFREEWEKGNHAILIGLLFPVIGVGIIIAAIRQTIRWRKFGQSVLRMNRVPAGLGGTLAGAIEIPSAVSAKESFKLRFSCVKRTTTGSGKNRRTREDLLWEEEREAPREAVSIVNRGTEVPVFFRLPDDQPESLEGNPAIVWRLEAKAEVAGVDYAETFSVPVFKTEEGAAASAEPDPLEAFQPLSAVADAPEFRGIEIRDLLDGVDIHYRAARNPGVIFSLGLFTAIWSGSLWFLATREIPVVFAIIWGFFDFILLVMLVFTAFHSMRVTVTGGRLTMRHWLIVPTGRKSVDASSVTGVEAVIGMRSGSKQFYRIAIKTSDGKTRSGGSGIPGKLQARWLSERLAIALGL